MINQKTLSNQVFSKERLTKDLILEFRSIIYAYFSLHKRKLPWRETEDPFHILVSEFMLQQTQTDRVIAKYLEFIHMFPTVEDLAAASFKEVLRVWSGLGYNRRAVGLKRSAEMIVETFNGLVPKTMEELQQLPGIGPYTAAAVCVFAFNKPCVMVETNIRSVFIFFFFEGIDRVDDRDIKWLVDKTLDQEQPREWFYALMDYGVMVKKRFGNPNRKSKSYIVQSPFKGSRREYRGMILRFLLGNKVGTIDDVCHLLDLSEKEVVSIIDDLVHDGLVRRQGCKIKVV